MCFYLFLWVFTGSLGVIMGLYVSLCVLIGPYKLNASLWVILGPFVSLWFFIDLCSF